MEWIQPWPPTLLALALLTAIATLSLSLFRVPRPLSALVAIARAVVQLAALSFVLAGILVDPVWVAIALVVMFVAAVATSARRVQAGLRHTASIAVAMLAGNLAVLAVVFGTGAIEASPRYFLAIGGIVIGNTMTIASLTGRAFRASVSDHWPEVEGWLALGATPRESTRALGRGAAHTGLISSIDQTKTTGIVVLPGAFVGAIFGGASPVEAGRFQIVVLASILAAGAITAVLQLRLIGGIAEKPEQDAPRQRGPRITSPGRTPRNS